MTAPIQDSDRSHWVNRSPLALRPYLQLSRLDRPVGYWLLTLPGWIGLAFASLSYGFASSDLKWAILILIGAIAMRGAGCTYNDIVDQDLDAQVVRTALRPLPAGTVTTKQAWIWLFAQCAVGLIVLLCLPRLAQIISLASIPLVAAYPFMKRITWWPQVWLGMTFNWAVLVAYAAKTGEISPAALTLYAGLIFWTLGYDTIYACQDIEDDMKIGVKSTARRFGKHIKVGIGLSYFFCISLVVLAVSFEGMNSYRNPDCNFIAGQLRWGEMPNTALIINRWYDVTIGSFVSILIKIIVWVLFPLHLIIWQISRFESKNVVKSLKLFKSNTLAGFLLVITFCLSDMGTSLYLSGENCGLNEETILLERLRPICFPEPTNQFCS